MNGDSTFYNLFGSDVSCLGIKKLRDLEIEFLSCETIDGAKRLLNFPAASGINRHFKL